MVLYRFVGWGGGGGLVGLNNPLLLRQIKFCKSNTAVGSLVPKLSHMHVKHFLIFLCFKLNMYLLSTCTLSVNTSCTCMFI